MAFRVLYDANAVFGALQRSILVRVGAVQATFNLRVLLTERILDEMIGHVSTKYPDFTDGQGASPSVNALMLEALKAEIARVKGDEDFMVRLRVLAERDREILDRLAE